MNTTNHSFSYDIDGKTISINCFGQTEYGEDQILFEEDDNLLENADWRKAGYKIVPFVTEGERKSLRNVISDLVQKEVERVTGHRISSFVLEKYHQYVDEDQHKDVVTKMVKVGLPMTKVPFQLERLDSLVSKVCVNELEVYRILEKPWSARISSVRIVRPMKKSDSNPLHRDCWQTACRHTVNIYFPVCGSNENSSLTIIPGSQFWKESEVERALPGRAIIDGNSYSVGCAVSSPYGLKMIRPNPKEDQLMVFTPYMIHGGAHNLNSDLTRVSLEMRFRRRGGL